MPLSSPNNTWSAIITPWAAKLNYTSQLASIKVADILSGNTCTPLSLSDFEGYLLFREHTVENLQFVVWYQDYRRRFFESTDLNFPYKHDRNTNDADFHIPSRVSIELRAAESCTGSAPTQNSTYDDGEKGNPEECQLQSHEITHDDLPESAKTQSPQRIINENPSISTAQHTVLPTAELPFKEECMRIVATFLRSASSKELSLDAMVRETIIRDLRTSTHPDVFVHAYREAYDMLETVSLQRFITHATINVNWQKQLYHYTVGFTLYCISIIVAVSLITTVPVPPQDNRAWRLFSIPWFFCGCTTSYSSFRGFCSEVGGRGNLQLRAWELEEHSDEETMIFSDLKTHDGSQSAHSHQSGCKNDREAGSAKDVFSLGLSSPDLAEPPSPFAINTTNMNAKAAIIAPFAEPFGDNSLNTPFSDKPQADKALTRPKIFGPERVVEDPRVKAVHQRLLWEIYVVALCGSVIYGAIIFSVPSGHA